MGGLTPSTEPSPKACIPFGCLWRQTQRATPSRGVFPGVVPPQDGPNLGTARDLLGSVPSRYSTEFYRFFGLSCSDYSSHSRVLFTVDYLFHMHVFFSGNRPPEELDNKRGSTRRGEFDSSTPEVIGVLLGQVFLA